MKVTCCCVIVFRFPPVKTTRCCVTVFVGTTGEGNVLLRDSFVYAAGKRRRVVAWLFCVYSWRRQRLVLTYTAGEATCCCVTVFMCTSGRGNLRCGIPLWKVLRVARYYL